MRIEEAIRYFEQRIACCKEAEALATKRPELKDLAESCHYEREALCAALRAMRGADKALWVAKQALQTANQATQVARDGLFQDTATSNAEANAEANAPNTADALEKDERRSEEEQNEW